MNMKEKYKNFWEKFSVDSIKYYEKNSNKTYNPVSLDSIIDYVEFFGGKIIYMDLFNKINSYELLLSQDNNKFLILIDNSYLKNKYPKNLDIGNLYIRKSILRMFSMYMQERIENGKIESNKIIYPENDNTSKLPIAILASNQYQEKKQLEKRKVLVITLD